MSSPKDSLKKYSTKRDFTGTPEPRGDNLKHTGTQPIFVVQQHDASSMHYDVRIEINGVLVSWAVPKGPSMDPHIKRLAVRTEDHPYDYASFEGVIPKGHYGAGAVIVWDTGTYTNLKTNMSMVDCLKKGEITIELHGQKLTGGFAFIKTHLSAQDSWLLVKMRDTEAQDGSDITQTNPKSVLTGETITSKAKTKK